VAASLAVAMLTFHDIHRASHLSVGLFGGAIFLPFTAAALFIGHHLIMPADRERRWIAPYHAYFDAAWMAGVQLVLSVAFTGAFWLLLGLGAALFHVIGVSALGDLIVKPAFALPVTGLVFATAVQLTDVRDGLIRGVRTIALMLLSWLLLLLTVLVAAFLAALPFTGLKGLWETGSATALVLATAGALVILINAAYQDGRPDNLPPAVLRVVVRLAAVLLTPLIGIAVWGLSLRIGQHGLTPDRIIAAACALVGAAYAVGYGLAALVPLARRGSVWMKALEPTNIAVAVLSLLVILSLFSPLADPAHLSVADQVKRLESGKVAPDKFDYSFLKFDSGKVGEAALAKLARSPNPAIASRATEARKATDRYLLNADSKASGWRITMIPAGTAVPAAFLAAPPPETGLGCTNAPDCVGRLYDLDGDGRDEFVIAQAYRMDVFSLGAEGQWRRAGQYNIRQRCSSAGTLGDARKLLKSDRLTERPALLPDLADGPDATWIFQRENGCG
jgi:hypothetical protein